MISIISDDGFLIPMEAARIRIDGWPDQEFFVHNVFRDGRIWPDRWVVTVSGHAVTDDEYATADQAIAAAQAQMDRRKRWQSLQMLYRALEVHRQLLRETG